MIFFINRQSNVLIITSFDDFIAFAFDFDVYRINKNQPFFFARVQRTFDNAIFQQLFRFNFQDCYNLTLQDMILILVNVDFYACDSNQYFHLYFLIRSSIILFIFVRHFATNLFRPKRPQRQSLNQTNQAYKSHL